MKFGTPLRLHAAAKAGPKHNKMVINGRLLRPNLHSGSKVTQNVITNILVYAITNCLYAADSSRGSTAYAIPSTL
jgi:hypothetical protein